MCDCMEAWFCSRQKRVGCGAAAAGAGATGVLQGPSRGSRQKSPRLASATAVPVVKNPPANTGDARDAGSIPGSGRSPGGGRGSPSSLLAWRVTDGEAWRATVHGVIRVGHEQ